MVVRLHKLFIFLAIVFFYSPRVSFFELPGSTSDIRLDVLIFFLVIITCFLICLKYLIELRINNFESNIFIIFAILGLLFLSRNGPFVYALFQLIWYGSILFFFIYAKRLVELGEYNNLQRLLRIFVNLNMFSHLSFWVLSKFGINLPTGQVSLIYGVFNMPYGFALMVGTYGLITFSNNFKVSKIEKLLIFTSILLGDSRVALGGFFIGMFIVLQGYQRIIFASFFAAVFVTLITYVSITDFRAINILFYSFADILSDPSLNVRLSNFYNYFDWVESNDFFLGYGPLSYMEYSIQYGKPGPLDVFYFRLFSDFGLFTSISITLIFIYLCLSNIKVFFKNNNVILALFAFCALYSFLNEGLLVIKLGHLVALMIGLVFWNIKLEKHKT